MTTPAEDALARAVESWAARGGAVRVTRVRRSTGRADESSPACANPAVRAPPHAVGRERWIVTVERLATLREQKVYVCDACADALVAAGRGGARDGA